MDNFQDMPPPVQYWNRLGRHRYTKRQKWAQLRRHIDIQNPGHTRLQLRTPQVIIWDVCHIPLKMLSDCFGSRGYPSDSELDNLVPVGFLLPVGCLSVCVDVVTSKIWIVTSLPEVFFVPNGELATRQLEEAIMKTPTMETMSKTSTKTEKDGTNDVPLLPTHPQHSSRRDRDPPSGQYIRVVFIFALFYYFYDAVVGMVAALLGQLRLYNNVAAAAPLLLLFY